MKTNWMKRWTEETKTATNERKRGKGSYNEED